MSNSVAVPVPAPREQGDGLSSRAILTIVVSSLGYFVDVFDLYLYTVYRVVSLTDVGVAAADRLSVGGTLLSIQTLGTVIGSLFWGALGDKRGRKSVLFGSILIYSLANLANAFVHDVTTYGALRFVAGVGLAGELGAAVTLIAELMRPQKRSYGTMLLFGVGLLGAVTAALTEKHVSWRTAYIMGGSMGLVLLVLRTRLVDSLIYEATKQRAVLRGSFRLLLANGRWKLYLASVLAGVPTFVGGLFVAFMPELSRTLGVTGPISVADIVLPSQLGNFLGSICALALSQALQSRKKVMLAFVCVCTAANTAFLTMHGLSPVQVQLLFLVSGFGVGYSAVAYITVAELFGTNLRATAATSAPGFVRASTVPMLLLLQTAVPIVGPVAAGLALRFAITAIGILAMLSLPETFGKDLDYVDT